MTNDNRTPTLRDYGFGSDDEFFANPGAAIARVAEGIETRLRGEYVNARQQEQDAARIEANWAKVYRRAPHLRHYDAEVRAFALDWAAKQPDAHDPNVDMDDAISRLIDAAEQHIRVWKQQEAEAEEAAVMMGGPGAEDEVDFSMQASPRSVVSILKQRRQRFQRTRSA